MIQKKAETKTISFPELFEKNKAVISISIDCGYANIGFEKDYNGKLVEQVAFLDDEGRPMTDECGEGGVSFDDIAKVAEFIKDLKAMRVDEMSAVQK
jgi:hypothetical protein